MFHREYRIFGILLKACETAKDHAESSSFSQLWGCLERICMVTLICIIKPLSAFVKLIKRNKDQSLI